MTVPQGATPQNRTTPGWGSWPEEFVGFQLETGLSSYWYSSGGAADPKKPPLPLTVDFEGAAPPASEPKDEAVPGDSDTKPGGGAPDQAAPQPTVPGPGPGAKPNPARLSVLKGPQKLDARGVTTLAKIACPKGAACRLVVPERTAKRIAGKRYLLDVLAPEKIAPGKTATVKVKLPKAAREALGAGKLTLRVPVVVRAGTAVSKVTLKVTIMGRG